MTTDNVDRILSVLREQNKVLATHGEALARVEVIQSGIRDILHGVNSQPGLIGAVARHSQQLNIYRGVGALLTLVWSAVIAIVASMVKAGHH